MVVYPGFDPSTTKTKGKNLKQTLASMNSTKNKIKGGCALLFLENRTLINLRRITRELKTLVE